MKKKSHRLLIIPKGNIECLICPLVLPCAYQPGSQPLWIAPLLTWCWRYVLMKKGEDEEGEHLHSWLPEERITAAYYYIKQLGGPCSPQITGGAFPMMTQYGDAYWFQAAQSMLHVFNDVTVQSPVGKNSWNVLQWITVRGQHLGRGGAESFDNSN